MKHILLSVLFTSLSAISFAQCSEIFISEYVEGSANSKAIEIYNPTANAIDLSQYTLKRYSNGSTSNPDVLVLSGTIQPYDVIVIANGQTDTVDLGGGSTSPPCDPALQALADILDNDYPAPCYFNGDDALTIEKGATIIDILGKVGEDPGGAWTTDTASGFTDANGGDWWTRNQTLIRKPLIGGGVTSNPALFNPALEYDSLPQNSWEMLGSHDCACDPNYVSVQEFEAVRLELYPNPVVSGQSMTLTSETRIKSYEIYSVVGQRIARASFGQPTDHLVIKQIEAQAGVYFIQVQFENGRKVTKRFVLN